MGFFDGIVDVVKSPFEAAADVATGGAKLLTGDFDGALSDFGDALAKPAVTAFEADIFFGMDLGDLASEIDDFLDQNPWLKSAIVAAGFAAGGVGGLVAAGAIAATDTMSEINEGTFDIGDIGRGGMEFGALYAGGAMGASAGGMALNTTAGQVKAGAELLNRSGLLGKTGRFVGAAAGAYAGNWASAAASAGTAATALRDTGLLGRDGDNVMNAVVAASGGDYGSLQTAVASGATALRAARIDEDLDPYLATAGSLASNDYDDVSGTIGTVNDALGNLRVVDGETERYLDAGVGVVGRGIDGDLDDFGDYADAASETGLLGDEAEFGLGVVQAVAGDDAADASDAADDGELILNVSETAVTGEPVWR